jgi:luciferase-like monooxygenase
MARLAESHGLFGVLAGAGDQRTAITAAVYASTATEFVRVIVSVRLGLEHPVTVAEELSVLDNVNNGRTVVLAGAGDLSPADAADELAVIREALGNRPIRHEGARWKVPAGLPANATAPSAIAVTPKPAQLEIPFWLMGGLADPTLPQLAGDLESISAERAVQPGVVRITGSLARDRETVSAWAAAGATHLLLELPRDAEHAKVMTMVSRYLAPEVAMPHFPRVMSDSKVPLPWPGDGRG